MIRVAIVDDDPFVRAGLRAILSTAPDLDVVGDADDGAGVPDLVGAARPDVVVMDIRMPRVDGIEATARLTAAGGSPRRRRLPPRPTRPRLRPPRRRRPP